MVCICMSYRMYKSYTGKVRHEQRTPTEVDSDSDIEKDFNEDLSIRQAENELSLPGTYYPTDTNSNYSFEITVNDKSVLSTDIKKEDIEIPSKFLFEKDFSQEISSVRSEDNISP
mmetsp:Transcript_34735/g.35430  ORF Transcript_34735/g.35430 Transcript_34735/m.35430 type:complete len:115 (+) Transcript_34735:2-346(+)